MGPRGLRAYGLRPRLWLLMLANSYKMKTYLKHVRSKILRLQSVKQGRLMCARPSSFSRYLKKWFHIR